MANAPVLERAGNSCCSFQRHFGISGTLQSPMKPRVDYNTKVTGKCGSVLVRLIPAPRGTGIVSAPVPKKLLQMAGVEDCYTSAVGQTATLGNFAKATYAAIQRTYSYLTPDLWKENALEKTPYQRYWEFLAQTPVRS
uniref:Small ribosomal subunit protein uS5 n=1 Tax=Ascaris suum TaxID=6253 RepID=F1LB08_ASCSU